MKPILFMLEQQRTRQRAEELHAFIKKCVDSIKDLGTRVIAVVTDNAANIGAAMAKMDDVIH